HNIRKLFDAFHLRGNRPLPRRMANRLLALCHGETVEHWLSALPDADLAVAVGGLIEPDEAPLPRRAGAKTPDSLTFSRTAPRTFAIYYWKTIANPAEGRFLNKNNADCVRDPVTQNMLPYHGRHLDPLASYLLAYYQKQFTQAHMVGKAVAGEHRFRWQTDLDFSWM